MAFALEILTLVFGGVCMLVALPRAPRRRRRTAERPRRLRPADLERIERIVAGSSSAADLHLRLRPVLVQIVGAKLRAGRVQHGQSASELRALLGEELWGLIQPGRPSAEELRGPGISLDRLEDMIERLEAL
jgi:hypothetical protein